jgi:uncharacterized membrane-anchored protein
MGMLVLGTGLFAQADETAPPKPTADQLATLDSGLKWQTGSISIKDGLAKINLTPDFKYLNAADSQKVLHDMWGNPGDPSVLGMIFPKDADPMDRGSWAVAVSYEEEGYVKDDDAGKINYDDLLKRMQKEVKEQSADLVKEGYRSVDLIGWAAPPRYDKETHKLYWAKELKFGNSPRNTLNYDIRILGRRGTLVLGAIAEMDDFTEIDQKVPTILSMVDFQPGNTYAEFDPKIDKVAEYGLAGLIAGGAIAGAAKLGLFAAFFKWIVVAAAATWKFLLIGIAALGTSAKKLWAKFTNKSSTPDHLLPPK